MTSNENPWNEISSAQPGQYSRLRVNTKSVHEMFWVRDGSNRPGLVIEISKTIVPAALKEAKINIRDIFIDVAQLNDGLRALVILLEEEQNLDVFSKLCWDLVDRITNTPQSENTFQLICQRLKKWQSLLSGKSKKLLSLAEMQGLYAEIYFIAEMILKDARLEDMLVNGWGGPERTQQDFILHDAAVEIKSVGGNQRNKVRISSEDQLETHLEKLYLRVYFMSEVSDSNAGESLNSIVTRISKCISNKKLKDDFELKLEAARYIDIPEYDEPLFRVRESRTYIVTEDFPKITRSNLPNGIEDVTYDLVLANLEKYRTSEDILGE